MVRKTGKSRIIWYIILALIVAVFAAWALLSFVSGYRLRAQMASKHILTIEDLDKEKTPDSENAAVILRHAFAENEKPHIHKDTAFLTNHFLNESEHKSNPKMWDQARRASKSTDGIVTLIEQAVSRPKCRFISNYRKDPYGYGFEESARIRELCRILRARAILAAHDGDMKAAVRFLDSNVKLVESYGDEPAYISHLVTIGMTAITCRTIGETVTQGPVNESQVRRLYDALSDINLNRSYARALEVERAYGIWRMQHPSQAVSSVYSTAGVAHPSSPPLSARVMETLWRPVSRLDQAVYVEMMQKHIDASGYTYREASSRKLYPDESSLPLYAGLSKMSCSLYADAALTRDTGVTRIRGTQAYLALLVHRNRYGSYPDLLKDLGKKIGWKLDTTDPLSGKSFIYRKTGTGFILYSIGQNMKDDWGVESKSGSSSGPDDIVWRIAVE